MQIYTVLRLTVRLLIGLVLVSIALYTIFGIKLLPVNGRSMSPTITEGEFILIDLFSHRWHAIKTGDVVLFQNAHNQYIVKRVLQDGTSPLIINPEGVMCTPQWHLLSLEPKVLLTLKHGENLDVNELFVVGDNRLVSHDSRNYGPIDRSQVVGQVIRIGRTR